MQTRNGLYINITNVDFRNQTAALQNIGTYYLSKVDKDFILNIEHVGVDNPISAGMANYQGTQKYVLFIDDNGRINQEYGNSDNIINSFYHESRHRYDATTWGGTIGEVNAILLQTTHESWFGVSDSFAQSQASYAATKLNSALNSFIELSTAVDYVQKLNNAFWGLSLFSIVDGKLSVSNNLKEVIVYGEKKK